LFGHFTRGKIEDVSVSTLIGDDESAALERERSDENVLNVALKGWVDVDCVDTHAPKLLVGAKVGCDNETHLLVRRGILHGVGHDWCHRFGRSTLCRNGRGGQEANEENDKSAEDS